MPPNLCFWQVDGDSIPFADLSGAFARGKSYGVRLEDAHSPFPPDPFVILSQIQSVDAYFYDSIKVLLHQYLHIKLHS